MFFVYGVRKARFADDLVVRNHGLDCIDRVRASACGTSGTRRRLRCFHQNGPTNDIACKRRADSRGMRIVTVVQINLPSDLRKQAD